MQIRALAVFSLTGDRRVVRFGPGLNIVTGWSATGKSSLLDIAEFCLGRTHPTYPVGVLTTAISWFAAEIEHAGISVVVARPAPASPTATVTNAVLLFGTSIDDISLDQLVANTDAKTIRAELSRLLGIPENQVRPGTLMQGPLAASASQALLLCFQGQAEIANRSHLFHRADDEEVEEAIRSTLPYFVGAVDVDTIALSRELSERQRDLRRARARLERARVSSDREVEGAAGLLAEAGVLGLTDPAQEFRGGNAVEELRRVRDLDLDQRVDDGATQTDAVLAPLRARQRELTSYMAGLEHRLSVLTRSTQETAAFRDELDEQRHRLGAIGLVHAGSPDEASAACPVCGQEVTADLDQVSAIRSDLSELDARLGDLREHQPVATGTRRQVEDALRQLRSELREVTLGIDAAVGASGQVATTGDLRARQSFLQGRATEFLASLPQGDASVQRLTQEVERLERETSELEDRLNPASFLGRTASLLRVISTDVTGWARRLLLGYGDEGVQIDPNALTIVADTRQGPVELDRMGSAANIMGYHVTAHLALHKWFVEQDRPVPNFLVLDQPSQVYFPDDVRLMEDEEISDEDRARITSLYELIRDVVAGLDGRLQVIVLDHANLAQDWFQAAVVENWRNGHALVPHEWIDTAPA